MAKHDIHAGWAFRKKATSFSELVGVGIDPWVEVTLPHDAMLSQTRDPSIKTGANTGYYPGGRFEYRRSFQFAETDRGKRITLVFDGVYRDALVYVNNALAGREASGYGRFQVRIDPYLRFGEDNEVSVDCRAHLDTRWYSGIGIYREAHMLVQDQRHIAADSVRVTTQNCDDALGIIEVEATIRNDSNATQTLRLSVKAFEASGAAVATNSAPVTVLPLESVTVRERLYVDRPKLWNVDSPNLYRAELALADETGATLDTDSVNFGMRMLTVDPKRGLRINGKPLKLRGACIHHDNGLLGAATIARAEERRVELLKKGGFNAIRSAHNPTSKALLDACDKHGVLVMDELSDAWNETKTDYDRAINFQDNWERDLEAMVARDYNHPSVVFYSIGNEITETGQRFGAAFGRKLANKLRALDPTRYTTNGVNVLLAVRDELKALQQAKNDDGSERGINAMMTAMAEMIGTVCQSDSASKRIEEAEASLDVAGFNYAESRYEMDGDLFPNRIIIGTETPPRMIDKIWAKVEKLPYVLGDFTWTGWDYLGEAGYGRVQHADDAAGYLGAYPSLTSAVGDMDIIGDRRAVSYYREIVFGLAQGPAIFVHAPLPQGKQYRTGPIWNVGAFSSWSWTGHEDKALRVEVYARADEIEIFLNKTSLGRVRVGEEKPYAAKVEVPFASGILEAVAFKDGKEIGRNKLESAGEELRLNVAADRTNISAAASDLAYVGVTLTDARGVTHVLKDRPVTVEVSGAGVLAGFGSAKSDNAESFLAATHATYHGRVMAIVRPTGAGKISLRATAEGCDPVTISIAAA